MRVLLAGLVSLLASGAFAQTDNVPPGGCMPIGLTARGDMVFPMQCRELIERERGPVPDQQLPVPEQRSQRQAPVIAPVIVAPAEKEIVTTGQPPERPG